MTQIPIDFEVKFSLFGKNYKTTVLAENKDAAKRELEKFILSKLVVIATEKSKSELNDLVEKAEERFKQMLS